MVLLLLSLLMRRWNQTGQKHAGGMDISKNFLPAHTEFLWTLVAITYLIVGLRLSQFDFLWTPRKLSYGLAALTCLAAFFFKVAFTQMNAPELLPIFKPVILKPIDGVDLVLQARVIFLAIAVYLVLISDRILSRELQPHTANRGTKFLYNSTCTYLLTGVEALGSLHDLITLLLLTQSRVSNIPLLLIFDCQLQLLESIHLKPEEITVTSVIFQHASFFAMGGSNAISSIDLSNAYNGVSGYNVVMVGILTFIGNWSGPLWWSSAVTLLLCRRKDRAAWLDLFTRHLAWCTAFVTAHLFFVMLACTILRSHLFVWTVFSPRYLYSIAWSVGQHLFINVTLAGSMFWFGADGSAVGGLKASNT